MWMGSPTTYFYSEKCPNDKPFFDGGRRGFVVEIPPFPEKCPLLSDGTKDKDCLEKNKKAEEDYYAEHCFSCEHDESMLIQRNQEKDIDRCQNRITIQKYSVLKKECPPDKPIQTVSGECIACDELNGQLIQDCSICPNTMVSQSGRCYLCDTGTIAGFTKEECQKCANTRWFSQETFGWAMHVDFCVPKKSPIDGRPLMTYGEIMDLPLEDTYFIKYETCDTPNIIKTNRETCDLCPNREYKDGYCSLKDDKSKKEEIDFCNGQNHLMGVSQKVCETKCPGWSVDSESKDSDFADILCAPTCPKETPMRNFDFHIGVRCYPCDEIHFPFSEIQCNKCPELREYKEGKCVFKKSPNSKYPLINLGEEIQTDWHNRYEYISGFYKCSTSKELTTTSENCALCPNREYVDGKCILKKENK